MGRIERSIEIRASTEKVWEMLAQDKHLEWFVGYKSVEYTSEVRSPRDKYMVGASAHVIATHDKFNAIITESVENEKIVYSIQAKVLRNCIYKYSLKPTEAGTDLTFLMEYEIPNPIIRIIDKLMWRSIISNTDKSLGNLKSILEK